MTPDFTRFTVRAAMILWLIPALLLCLAPTGAAADQRIQLRDGDSFVLDGQEIRLWGIDAPEFFQTCRDAAGLEYSCGRRAKDHLQDLIGRGPFRCEPTARAKNETRIVARCFVGADDLGQLMVRSGWAVEYRYFSKGVYAADELQAKNANRGFGPAPFETRAIGGNLRKNDVSCDNGGDSRAPGLQKSCSGTIRTT